MISPDLIAPEGLRLRPVRTEDTAFTVALFTASRWAEFEVAGWPDEVRRQFLAHQCSLQTRHYAEAYGEKDFFIVERDGAPIGRLLLYEGVRDLRIVDISLMPDACGAGYGTALLKSVQAKAMEDGKSVSIHVELHNPARRLYNRLGFVEGGGSPYVYMEWRAPDAA